MTTPIQGEKRYEQVYGDTFALYSPQEFLEFMQPFEVRFERNGIDPEAVFSGKRCLDAGCGNGRGSLFMLRHGAASVVGYDFCEKNIRSATDFLTHFGHQERFTARQGTLENIPFSDESFDVVWCNGVVMHTAKPNRCLSELTRVLKTGGNMWLYVYGSGGVYWRIIRTLRCMLRGVPVDTAISALRLMRYETRYIAEFVDDWFATHLRTYTHEDLGRRLNDLGFASCRPLPFGMDYDTNHRINTLTGQERELMGEGDLRYLLTKTGSAKTQAHEIPESEYGSDYQWAQSIRAALDHRLERLEHHSVSPLAAMAAAAKVQRELRLFMTESRNFFLSDITTVLDEVLRDLEALASGVGMPPCGNPRQ